MSQSKVTLSERVLSMQPSATIATAQKARELKNQGHDVISLSLGEPDFDTPDHIKEAAKKALDAGITKYTPVSGLASLKNAVKTKFKRDNNIDAELNQIVVSNGAKQSIANLCLSLLNEGDEAIVLAPYWVSYEALIKLAGGVPVILKAGIERDFKVSADEIKNAITPKTKFVIFSSPCNPTGSVYSKEELTAIADVLAGTGIAIISDEIYEYINFGEKHFSIGSLDSVKDQVCTVNGFAKGFAMTGWRLGYMAAPAAIAKACEKIQGQITSGANAFSQEAAAFALTADMSPTTEMRNTFEKRKKLVIDGLNTIPGLKVNNPTGAFYVFPDVSYYFGKSDGETTIKDATHLCTYILEKSFVAVVTGVAFGDENCFRISYAASEEQLTEAIKRIKAALSLLK